jgi:hypothetical protein
MIVKQFEMVYDKKEVRSMDRQKVFAHMDTAFIILELVLSAIFFLVGHFMDSMYIRGVGVGLTISWVTIALATYIKNKKAKP